MSDISATKVSEPKQRDQQARNSCNFVLLVEDDNDIAQAVLELLDDEGVTASRAHNGQEALKVLEGGPPPCLIILDLTMPVMTGWEFLEHIRQLREYAKVPVAVFSALADERALRHAQGAIRKPPVIEQMMEMVDKFCGDNCRINHTA